MRYKKAVFVIVISFLIISFFFKLVFAEQLNETISSIEHLNKEAELIINDYELNYSEDKINITFNLTIIKYNTSKYSIKYFIANNNGKAISTIEKINLKGKYINNTSQYNLLVSQLVILEKYISTNNKYDLIIEGLNQEVKQKIMLNITKNNTKEDNIEKKDTKKKELMVKEKITKNKAKIKDNKIKIENKNKKIKIKEVKQTYKLKNDTLEKKIEKKEFNTTIILHNKPKMINKSKRNETIQKNITPNNFIKNETIISINNLQKPEKIVYKSKTRKITDIIPILFFIFILATISIALFLLYYTKLFK